jgi:hypothetical protein
MGLGIAIVWSGCAGMADRDQCLRRAVSSPDPAEARKTCRQLFDDAEDAQRTQLLPKAVLSTTLFVLDEGVCRPTAFDAFGQRGTITGCSRQSSSFQRLDGQLVHVCIDDDLQPIVNAARLSSDAIYLKGEVERVLYFNQPDCFVANTGTSMSKPREPGCCECLASRTHRRKPCLEDTVAGCRERFDPNNVVSRNLPDANGYCVSFLCRAHCTD